MKTLNKPLLLAVIAAFGFVGSASAAIIGHWELEEGSGTTAFDVSGSTTAHDGTLTSDPEPPATSTLPTWETTDLAPVPSGTNAKLSFTEGTDSRVEVADNDELSVNESGDTATIALWFFADTNADNSAGFLVSKNEEYAFRLLDDGDNVRLRMDLFGSNSGGNGGGIAEGGWNHAAATWTAGGDGTLYLNGEVYDSWTSGATSTNAGETFALGNRVGPASGPELAEDINVFAGDLDDVRLYDTVLTQSEIQALAVVPEPSAFALLAGCFGLTWVMLRRRS